MIAVRHAVNPGVIQLINMMRKLVYLIATSLDGFVSRDDGDISDFSFDGEHVADLLAEFPESIPTHLRSIFNINASNKRFDTVLMGRSTYELGVSHGVVSPYQHLKQFVFSKTLSQSPDPSIELVKLDALSFVRRLKQDAGLDIWLCGGPKLASVLVSEIDNIILKINPFLMGQGKSIFDCEMSRINLKLVDRKDYSNGFSLVHYSPLAEVGLS